MANFNPTLGKMLGNMIPINRFNRGEASKIFAEVEDSGVKVVLKNNTPVGIILTPEMYASMVKEIEDIALLLEANERMYTATNDQLLNHDQVKKSLGLKESDLDDMDVEIES